MTKCVLAVVNLQKHVFRTCLKSIIIIIIIIIIIAFEWVQPFIIHEKFQNLPDMPDACRMKMSLMEAEKLKPWREDGVFARTKR